IDSGNVTFTTTGQVVNSSFAPLTFTNLGSGASSSITFADTVARSDTLIYNGTSTSDAFAVTAAGVITLNSQIAVNTSGVANLTLRGLEGDDTFNLTGGVAFTTTTIDGSGPSASDVVTLTGATGLVTVNLGDSTVPGNTTITGYGGTITLIADEVVDLNANSNALTINGTAQPDSLTYTPTGASAGTVRSANLNTVFNFSAATGTFTLDADGGTDTVTVNGTSGAD